MNEEGATETARSLDDIGKRMARGRLGRNITQQELARISGVSRQTLHRLESGDGRITLCNFIRICQALDLVDALRSALPSKNPGPMELLNLKKPRLRARRSKSKLDPAVWTWGN
jgi:transcriptional regulator with XRE-family HTH domain